MASGFSLVLGGGGAVGLGYVCGVLHALEEVTGVDLAAADVLIGTSVGAVVAADLRLGRPILDIYADRTRPNGEDDEPLVTKAWSSRADLARRIVGASSVAARAITPFAMRLPPPPRFVQRAFPGSLLRVRDAEWAQRRFPDEWPEEPLWLAAYDIDRGARAVLRRDGHPPLTLPRAVEASCAVPAAYAPVRAGGRRLVDGGVRSPTNLDLAADVPSATVIAIAPLAVEGGATFRAAARRRFNRVLAREAAQVRGRGKQVVVFRPSIEELRVHGLNLLSDRNLDAVFDRAYTAAKTSVRTMELARTIT